MSGTKVTIKIHFATSFWANNGVCHKIIVHVFTFSRFHISNFDFYHLGQKIEKLYIYINIIYILY